MLKIDLGRGLLSKTVCANVWEIAVDATATEGPNNGTIATVGIRATEKTARPAEMRTPKLSATTVRAISDTTPANACGSVSAIG